MRRNLSVHSVKSTLPETIDHRAKLYAIAAAAAGVSMLALAPPAEGEVVVTKKNIPIPVSVYGGHQYLVPISLNNDGITDFSFSLYSFAYHSFFQDLTVTPVEGGATVGAAGPKGVSYASALVRGAKIGPSAHFSSQGRANVEVARGFNFSSSHYSRKLYGNWGGSPANRYLGVRFLIDGATHYGWIRLTVNTQPHTFSATITGYAYETFANKRILAGIQEKDSADIQAQPKAESPGRPSLGMLALGADGLTQWRSDATLVH
jgi:hypothetical protein